MIWYQNMASSSSSTSVILAVIIPFLYTSLLILIRQFRSPLRHLPGPPSSSLFMGNLQQMHDQENTNLIARWVSQYGPTFVYRGFLGGRRLITTDPIAIAHILGNPYHYPKPEFIKDTLANMAAGHHGLLTVEGDQHRRQVQLLFFFSLFGHLNKTWPQFKRKILVSDNLGHKMPPAQLFLFRHLLSLFLILNL